MHLAGAAHASHPERVIRFAMHHAHSIMDANQAGHYGLAAQWLEKAALAHEALGREDNWRACLDEGRLPIFLAGLHAPFPRHP
jgi:uncharacterized Zn finger protein